MRERDQQYNGKVKGNAENKNTKLHKFEIGDHVNSQTVNDQQSEDQFESMMDNVPKRSDRVRQPPDRFGDYVYY